MLTAVDLGRMAANLRLADNAHQYVEECIGLLSSAEARLALRSDAIPADAEMESSRHILPWCIGLIREADSAKA
jgi:hypothetical protein